MKTKMSYKSKKIAIITAIILVLIGGISIGIYYYNKGNAEIKASTDENVVNNSSENLIITDGTSEANETDENVAENSVEETNNTSSDNDVEETENTETTNSNNTVSNNGTSNNENSDEELPNEEYTQIDRIETGRQILVREGLAVGWVNAGLNKANVSTNILVNRPELEVHKQAKINSISQEDNSVQVGSKITYEITVKNNSKTVDAKNVTVTDKIPEGTTLDTETPISNEGVLSDGKITWLVDVNKESSVTVSFTVIVESTEGDIKNVAIADGKDSEETTNPVISTNKSVSSEENMNELKEGSKVKYTISVTNNGNEVAKTTVKDSAPEGTTLVENSVSGIDAENISVDGNNITWNNVELNPGETKLLTFEVTVNAFEGESKVIENIALVGDKTTNPSDITVYNPIINSEKTSNKTAVVVGEEIEYTITVTNSGKVEGTAKVTDTIPEGTSFVEGSIKVNGVERKDLGETDLNTGIDLVLGAGEEGTVSFKVTVEDVKEGTIINTAKVNGEDTETEKNPIITFTKKVDKTEVKAGEKLLYTIEVTNNGEVEGTAKVADEKPEGTSLVEGSIKVSNSEETYTEADLNNGIDVTVPAGEKVTVTFEVTVGDLEDKTVISNKATVNGKPTDETETTYQEAVLSFEKTSNKTAVAVGEEIEYTITVTNSGTAEGTAKVTDTVPEGTSFVEGSIKVNGEEKPNLGETDLNTGIDLTLGAGEEGTVSFKVTVEDAAKGTIINTAKVNGKDTNTEQNPIFKATKSVSQKTIKEGEKLVYTITVTNTGKVEGTAKVADEKPEGTSFVEGSIKVSNSDKTYTETDLNNGIDVTVPAQGKVTVTFEVTVGKLENNAEIKNTASLNGKPTNEVTTTFKEPELQISKTAETVLDRDNGVVIPGQDPAKAEVGDTIVYTIKVNNVSDVETEVNLEDKLPDHVSFVNGSIKVTGGNASNASYENRTVKYTGTLAGGKELKIEFRVTVNENTPVGTDIKNIATVNGKDTNETNTHIVKKVTVTTTAQTMNSLDLVLVLDTSGSMKDPGTNGKTRMENLKEAATNLVNRVFSTNTDSTITAITYDTDVNWGTRTYSFSGKQQLLNKIKGLSANGGTNIYKALEETNNVIDDMSGTNRTRVVVFLTDGAPTYWSYADGANHVTNNNKNESGSYRNNLRPQIIAQANELKAKENVTVYSVGLGVNNLNNSSEVQYVEKNPPQNVRDYFNGYSNRWGYWYMYTRTYAQYLLNNISSSGKYIEPSNLNDTFDDILSEQTTSKHVYDAEELPVTIQINETREILGNVTVKIGDNGREREYSLAQLRRGVNGLTYVDGTGFTWVISDDSILNENLYISYKVEGVAE